MYYLEWSKDRTLRAGDVIRVGDSAFMDVIILGFNDQDEAKVSRPYAYASSVGTTGPVPLLGTETYTLPFKHLAGCERLSSGRIV